jgi:protein-disulfide isomerase
MTASPRSRPPDIARRLQVAAALVAAAVVAVVIVLVSAGGGGGPSASRASAVPGAAETAAMLAGIPQRGVALGDPRAPVTLVEIADAQCPFCRRFALYELPHVIQDQVRRGRLRIELRLVAFLGPDSERGRRILQAAAAQDRLWNAAHLLYFNQGAENSGYLTDAFARRTLAAVGGLDVPRVLRQRSSGAVAGALRADDRLAARAGVQGTPTFLIGPTGRRPRVLSHQLIGAADIAAAVDRLAPAGA